MGVLKYSSYKIIDNPNIINNPENPQTPFREGIKKKNVCWNRFKYTVILIDPNNLIQLIIEFNSIHYY